MLKDIHMANANVCHPAYSLRKIFILATLTASADTSRTPFQANPLSRHEPNPFQANPLSPLDS